MANQTPNFVRRVPVSKPYLITRSQALHLAPSNFSQFMESTDVYGVIVDMPMAGQVITTLACYVNGAANLYFSNGGDYSGAAQRYPGVVQAARVFVSNAAGMIAGLEPVKSLELPFGNRHFAYILTTHGIYRLDMESQTNTGTQPERVFKMLYHRVMGELRSAQMKDKATGIDPKTALEN